MNLKQTTVEEIDHVIPKYPTKRSAVLPLCHLVQADQGFISNEAVEWIAEKLELQPINVYEVVTFYPYFRQKPIGKHHIRVCRTLPCALVGSYKICDKILEEFKCPINGTSDDGNVTVEFAECLASCGSGPVVLVDEKLYENVDDNKIKEIASHVSKNSAS